MNTDMIEFKRNGKPVRFTFTNFPRDFWGMCSVCGHHFKLTEMTWEPEKSWRCEKCKEV